MFVGGGRKKNRPPLRPRKAATSERPEDLLSDQIDWPESIRFILTGRSNRTVGLTFLPDHLAGRRSRQSG